jgi:hypothetical protein
MMPSVQPGRLASAPPTAAANLTESRLIAGLLIAVAVVYLGLFLTDLCRGR